MLSPQLSALSLDFDWWQDARGCRLIRAPQDAEDQSTVPHPLGIRVGIGPDRYRIVRAGGALTGYRPFERFDLGFLHRRFAKIREESEALDFVSTYGPLTKDGLNPDVGDDLDTVLVHAESMTEMLSFASGGKQKRARVIDAQIPIEFREKIGSLSASLVMDAATGRPRLHLSPPSFLDALWLSIYVDISQNGNLRFCRLCGERIENSRRADAQFCNQQHKRNWFSWARSSKLADASRPGLGRDR